MPDGRQRKHQVEVSDRLKSQYKLLQNDGCRLTTEVLSTGEVSQCIEHIEGDIDMRLSSTDDAIAVLEQMIQDFDRASLGRWLKEVRSA